MSRFFNLDGPCDPDEHFMIPASRRLGDEILDLGEVEAAVAHSPPP